MIDCNQNSLLGFKYATIQNHQTVEYVFGGVLLKMVKEVLITIGRKVAVST